MQELISNNHIQDRPLAFTTFQLIILIAFGLNFFGTIFYIVYRIYAEMKFKRLHREWRVKNGF